MAKRASCEGSVVCANSRCVTTEKRQGGGRTEHLSRRRWREVLYTDFLEERCVLVTAMYPGKVTRVFTDTAFKTTSIPLADF